MNTWKGFKGRHHKTSASEGSSSPSQKDAFNAAVATVVRAAPRNFRAVREEWAAIRIQTAFRGFLVIWVSFYVSISHAHIHLLCFSLGSM